MKRIIIIIIDRYWFFISIGRNAMGHQYNHNDLYMVIWSMHSDTVDNKSGAMRCANQQTVRNEFIKEKEEKKIRNKKSHRLASHIWLPAWLQIYSSLLLFHFSLSFSVLCILKWHCKAFIIYIEVYWLAKPHICSLTRMAVPLSKLQNNEPVIHRTSRSDLHIYIYMANAHRQTIKKASIRMKKFFSQYFHHQRQFDAHMYILCAYSASEEMLVCASNDAYISLAIVLSTTASCCFHMRNEQLVRCCFFSTRYIVYTYGIWHFNI